MFGTNFLKYRIHVMPIEKTIRSPNFHLAEMKNRIAVGG